MDKHSSRAFYSKFTLPISVFRNSWSSTTLKTRLTLIPLLLAWLTSSTTFAGDYLERPELNTLIKELKEEHEFKEQELRALFAKANRQESIIKAMKRPAEKTKTWAEYRKIFITPKSVKNGKAFWEKHSAAIKEASECYGVPEEIIVAIIGVETRYGQNRGSYRVLDALSTLAFDYPPRSDFFYKELRQFVILTRETGIDATSVKGSYAGAMGYPQFIPSSYRNFAVDFDKNGTIDLVSSPTDAIGSVANYFKVHGWMSEQPVVVPAQREQGKKASKASDVSDLVNRSLKPDVALTEIESRGFSIGNEESQPFKDKKGTFMELEGQNGTEHWVGLHNFYVITRYNHSRLYAMAVYQLSKELTKI